MFLPVYEFQEETADNQAAIIGSIFDNVIAVKDKTVREDETDEANFKLDQLKKEMVILTENASYVPLSDESLAVLLNQTSETLNQSKNILMTLVSSLLSEPILTEDLSEKKMEMQQKIVQRFDHSEDYMNVLSSIARMSIVETELENEVLTKLRIEQAIASVEPTRILQGQILVQKGEIIDREVYRQLELLGMLTNKTSSKPIIGTMLFVLLTMWVIYVQTTIRLEKTIDRSKALVVVSFSLIVSVLMMKVLQIVSNNFDVLIGFLFPAGMVSMLVYILVNERAAFITSFVSAAYAGIVFQEGYSTVFQMEFSLYILFGGIAGIYALQRLNNNSQILRSSLIVSSVNILFITFYLLMTKTTYGFKDIGFYVGAAVIIRYIIWSINDWDFTIF